MNVQDARWLTTAVIVATALWLIAYDIVIIALFGREASVSLVVYDLARAHPIIACALGVLIGHWLFPLR